MFRRPRLPVAGSGRAKSALREKPGFPGPGEADSADFLDVFLDFVPAAETRKMTLADNPGKLYDFDV